MGRFGWHRHSASTGHRTYVETTRKYSYGPDTAQ